MGQASKRLPASLRFHLFIMSSGGGSSMGHQIFFGALSFIVDDSAWLRDAPLDVEALPRRGATHFRAGARAFFFSSSRLRCQPTMPSRVATSYALPCRRPRHSSSPAVGSGVDLHRRHAPQQAVPPSAAPALGATCPGAPKRVFTSGGPRVGCSCAVVPALGLNSNLVSF